MNDAFCEYFKTIKARKIKCRGLVDGASTYIQFPGDTEGAAKMCRDFYAANCGSKRGYLNCPMYAAIERRAEENYEPLFDIDEDDER